MAKTENLIISKSFFVILQSTTQKLTLTLALALVSQILSISMRLSEIERLSLEFTLAKALFTCITGLMED